MSTECLCARNLTVVFGGIRALSNVSFDAGPESVVGIVGPNGSGKTTLLDVLSGFRKPLTGSALLHGTELIGRQAHEIAWLGVRRTFQTPRLFDSVSPAGHLLIAQPTHFRGKMGLLDSVGSKEARAAWARNPIASMVFERIPEHTSRLPFGQRRLLELARAVEGRPRVLLLDEPSSGMNDAETEILTRALQKLNKNHSITILLVDHNVPFVRSTCDRLIAIDTGLVIADGSTQSVLADRKVVDAYLGH